MQQFYKRIIVFVCLIFGLGFGFIMIRSSVDEETGKSFADAMSVLPFSDAILHWLRSLLPLDATVFDIHQERPFVMQLLILLVEAVILSPILLAINNLMGPILLRTRANEYSVAGDWNAARTKDKIVRRLVKLLLIAIIVPVVAFFSGYLLDMLFGWVNGLFIVWRVLCYALAFVIVVAIALIPVFLENSRKRFVAFGVSALQRILYVFITNVVILAVVALLVAGASGWDFMVGLLVMLAWMTCYSDTDGFLAHKIVRANA